MRAVDMPGTARWDPRDEAAEGWPGDHSGIRRRRQHGAERTNDLHESEGGVRVRGGERMGEREHGVEQIKPQHHASKHLHRYRYSVHSTVQRRPSSFLHVLRDGSMVPVLVLDCGL